VISRKRRVKRTQGEERGVGETKLGDVEFVGEKGGAVGQVKMKERDVATLDSQATQEMRKQDGYETIDSREGKNWGGTVD
jgi:hypothetical protein